MTISSLQSISITSASALSPAFSSAVYQYTATVIGAITCTVVTPVTTSTTATSLVNGNVSPFTAPLNVGSNIITIVVTAQDGITQNVYTLNITRATFNVPSGELEVFYSK